MELHGITALSAFSGLGMDGMDALCENLLD